LKANRLLNSNSNINIQAEWLLRGVEIWWGQGRGEVVQHLLLQQVEIDNNRHQPPMLRLGQYQVFQIPYLEIGLVWIQVWLFIEHI